MPHGSAVRRPARTHISSPWLPGERRSHAGDFGGISSRAVSDPSWNDVEDWTRAHAIPDDDALTAAVERSDAGGLPSIQVYPTMGKFLNLVARMVGAQRILEVGTLAGYSTIWLARALPTDGKLITLEFDPKHAKVAKENIDGAGLGEIVDLRVGPALDELPRIAEAGEGPFDLVFIDAD